MELFNPRNLKFNFANTFKFWGIVSVVGVLLSIVAFVFKPGINYGIDFRGGIEASVKFAQRTEVDQLRGALKGYLESFDIVEIDQTGGRGFFITAQAESKENISVKLSEALNKGFGTEQSGAWSIQKLDSVGPKIGAELRKSALLSLIYTCLLIALYIYIRFDVRYAPGALLSIFHDLVITAGFLALTQTEFSTTVVAALLTLAGYSINDTVVIFDRIRETEEKVLGKTTKEIVNLALNSTLPRTIMTSGTTLISTIVLYFFGGSELQPFALTLMFGVLLGTYSSVFIASPLFLLGHKWIKEKNPEGAEATAS